MTILQPISSLLFHIGRYVMLIGGIFKRPEKLRIYYEQTMIEAVSMVVGSMFIVVIISTFIGAVTTLQTAYQLTTPLIADSVIGSVVSASTLLELSPTVLSFILAGRIGSNIASQIGTMRVTEQIDALEVMGINSKGYLLIPRLVAGLFSFPILITISAFLSTMGGLLAGDISGEVTAIEYLQGMEEYYDPLYINIMYVKAIIFGILIVTISAYQGYFVRGGALEVGKSATRAVVYSCLTMVVADYFVAQLLL
ncbi:MAG: MlaE family ABC transporter permease [Bacteroidia bacterium]